MSETPAQTKITRTEDDPIRCRYTDCVEQHPVVSDKCERTTCPTCRAWMGLDTLPESLS